MIIICIVTWYYLCTYISHCIKCVDDYVLKTSRETLLKTDSIKFDSTGDYIVTAVSNDASISDDETSISCDNDYDGAHSILDEVDNRIIESWD